MNKPQLSVPKTVKLTDPERREITEHLTEFVTEQYAFFSDFIAHQTSNDYCDFYFSDTRPYNQLCLKARKLDVSVTEGLIVFVGYKEAIPRNPIFQFGLKISGPNAPEFLSGVIVNPHPTEEIMRAALNLRWVRFTPIGNW